jgi:hypothetical protein
MNDAVSNLTEREVAELSALADGTLPPDRLEAVKARVDASPELQKLVERQRLSLTATRSLAEEEPSAALTETVGALGRKRTARRSRWLIPRVAGGVAVAMAVLLVVVLTGGPAGPTVADAAGLADQAPNAPAPRAASAKKLRLEMQGVAFPNLATFAGWKPLGARHGTVGGREATVVFYGKGDRRIAYVIVGGAGLRPPPASTATKQGSVEYRTLRVNGRLAVTWRRGGHTCILIGQATPTELLGLASWPFT